MKVIIADIKDIIKQIDESSLTLKFQAHKRNVEYSLGRFLVNCGAKAFYGKENFQIDETKQKPFIKYAKFDFSISHSDNLIGVAFADKNAGFDAEKIKPRNLERLSKRYGVNFETEKAFYKFWTSYEAKYKSGVDKVKTFEFGDYMISVSSENLDNITLYGLKICENNFNLNNIDFSKVEIEKIVF